MDSSSISVTVSYEVRDTSSSTDSTAGDEVPDEPPARSSSSVEDNFLETDTAAATIVEDVDRTSSSSSKNKREVEMMKERFARLLLGEDMSGGGKGVGTALAISNAITNLSVSVFGNHWRLEPLSSNRKKLWKREMDVLLAVTDHIVELVPTWQSAPDGTSVEIMVSKPRRDIHINLPALRKLDAMLLQCLDGFQSPDFWYVEQEHLVCCRDMDPERPLKHEGKWWLPVPKVPPAGLSDDSKKSLQQLKESTNQIFKAATAINAQVLSEMEVPDAYLESLPKNGKLVLGEIYRCLTAEPDAVLSTLDLSNEFNVIQLANRLEACIHIWHHKLQNRHLQPASTKDAKFNAKASWVMMKELVVDTEKREVLVENAERLLTSLRHKFPGLPQSTLDMYKIQYNKDVGQSILESYSRVLESLAFNIIARIDGVLSANSRACCCTGSTCSEASHEVSGRSTSSFATGSFATTTSSSSTAESMLTRDSSRRQKPTMALFSPGKTLADYMRLDPFTKRIYASAAAHACELETKPPS